MEASAPAEAAAAAAVALDPSMVFDARLAAGRGENFSASAIRAKQEAGMRAAWEAGRDYFMPMSHVDDALETEGLVQASLETAIPAHNRGYALLCRMGWTAGKGLGRNEDGMVEPIRGGVEAGIRLGLGKQEQETFYMAAQNVTRKRLETEVQGDEDEDRTQRRELAVQREQAIHQDVSEVKRRLFCDTCRKQYKTAMEMETHLSSYDHHHTKRLQETKRATADRTRVERERRQRRAQEKEAAKLNHQIARAQQARGGSVPPAAPPPLPPPDEQPWLPPPACSSEFVPPLPPGSSGSSFTAAPPPPPPSPPPPCDLHESAGMVSSSAFGITFGQAGATRAGPRVASAGFKFGGGMKMGAQVKSGGRLLNRTQLKPAVAAFQMDSDDET